MPSGTRKNRFDLIFSDFLAHVTDEKPITARQCIKVLVQVGTAKPQYIPRILSCLQSADLSKYKDSMRPLIEKDIAETEKTLKALQSGELWRYMMNTMLVVTDMDKTVAFYKKSFRA